jgi:hypothetical protein
MAQLNQGVVEDDENGRQGGPGGNLCLKLSEWGLLLYFIYNLLGDH